jgi:hypothetical protein
MGLIKGWVHGVFLAGTRVYQVAYAPRSGGLLAHRPVWQMVTK